MLVRIIFGYFQASLMVKNRREKLNGRKLVKLFFLIACLLFAANAANANAKFDRTYNTRGPARLTISNINGSITVTAWNRRAIAVSANNAPSAPIEEEIAGDNIMLSVKKSIPPGKVDFQIFVPAETSLTLKN
jgi:hypothetical protein